MEFAEPLIKGTLLKRYMRFLADIRLNSGEVVTAACPNTGTMLGLTDPGLTVYLSKSASLTRKYPHTWELVDRPGHGLIGINTARPNSLVETAIRAGVVPALRGYETIRREVKYGVNSRIDLLLETAAKPPCYVEVKNVTLYRTPGRAEFPDCATARGTKHLGELAAMAKQGNRAMMVYCIQGGNPQSFNLTADIDPIYKAAAVEARREGVEAIAVTCHVTLQSIQVTGTVPLLSE